MGCWDEVCLVCGISYGGSDLVSSYEIEAHAQAIAQDLLGHVEGQTEDDLKKLVCEGLDATITGDHSMGRKAWMPPGLGEYKKEVHDIAVGYFNQHGDCDIRDGKVPDGKAVEVRSVTNGDSGFTWNIVQTKNGKEVVVRGSSNHSCVHNDGNPNFMVCGHCYHYVKNWVEWESLPPRACAFSDGSEPLSFAGEFYEIVNSRKQTRNRDIPATLPEIDYDGIELTLEQWQDHYIGARRGAKRTAQAIQAGLRGADLLPALLRDSRAWMFMPPNLYPKQPDMDRTPTFTLYPPSPITPLPGFAKLPNELLFHLLPELPLASLLALASTCRSMRSLILEPSFLDHVLKEALVRGSLRWILPVADVGKEARRAYDVLRLWLPDTHRPEPLKELPEEDKHAGWMVEDEDDEDQSKDEENDALSPPNRSGITENPEPIPPVEPLLTSPHFPRLAFIRECWESDSIMNRKRLWGQAKQFEALWRDYRLHGWQVDRFYPSGLVGKVEN